MKATKFLTRSEFQVMCILWNLPNQSGCTGDVLAKYEEPKPAYTTLATFLKILCNKGFLKYRKRKGKLYYTPVVSQTQYAEVYCEPIKDVFFHGSFKEMARFLLAKEQLSEEDKEELIKMVREA